ncbi:MAG: hypothetical protein A2283_22800 [Lentisphaerae bacterium RIFOXYA12_FULL_48_11]|nr:MAG: hypothetical protein A2283_22800 [Lentisphaerae bacterium RIFOXYA12_FULL_48_11]
MVLDEPAVHLDHYAMRSSEKMKKYITIGIAVSLLATGGCSTSRIVRIPYNSVRIYVESELKNPDHLAVWVGGIETNMPTQQALTLLSDFYSSHGGNPPPMVVDIETKIAVLDNIPGGNFLDAIMTLQTKYNFQLYIQPLPYSQAPAVNEELDDLWSKMKHSNKGMNGTR